MGKELRREVFPVSLSIPGFFAGECECDSAELLGSKIY